MDAYLRVYFEVTPHTYCFLVYHHVSSCIIQNIRKRTLDLHKSNSSLPTTLTCPRVPHLFKQFFASITTIGLLSAVQEGDRFCVTVMNVLWCDMCISTPEQNLILKQHLNATVGKLKIGHKWLF
ncbi:hypothetical protein XENOCAPTIV_022579 [Xenoophorus captivus]|uniref:Uncharacterized protein n=1 Tax=Xenoophorus captivus TaxID=1517983 RepID=A0ABV0R1M3_9TELE